MQDDKKKLMVLAALGVVLLGLGAFTLMPGDPPKPAGPQASGWKPPVEEKKDEVEPPRNPMVVAALPQRDPFEVPAYAREKDPVSENPQPESTKVDPLPKPNYSSRPRAPRGLRGNLTAFREELGGGLPAAENTVTPVQPNVGSGANPATGGTLTTKVEPTPAPPEPTFDYTLNGVIVGRRPAAVLKDKNGNQRLVTVGGMIDGDSTLIEVRQGAAIVDVRGKRRRIELNGDTDAK